jgi:hypothetical protein
VQTDCRIEDNEVIDTATGATLNGSNSWRLYPQATAVRSKFRRNTAVSAGSGTFGVLFSGSTGMFEVSADRGDANVTLQAGVDAEEQRFATALGANRTVTLATTNVHPGAKFRIFRTGLGAFTLDVGGLKTIPSATAAFVDVEYDAEGAAWRLTGYGTL